MSKLTEVLKLLCYDPETDGAYTFNIPKALNENWEKIDAAVAGKFSREDIAEEIKKAVEDGSLIAGDLGAVSEDMVGAPNGVAGLDETGKVPESQLPELDFDPSGSAAAVQQQLEAHTASKNNPHGVTAAQVGAFTKAQTLTAETAALFGLGADATPNSVLAQIKTLLNQCNAAADAKTMSELKSYVGTGTYGASNPMSLSFSFTPFIVMCVGYKMTGDSYNTYVATFDQGSIPQIVVSALTTSYVQGRGLCWDSSALQYAYGKRSADSKTIYWYNTYGSGGGAYQFNSNGYTYYFLAIGRK